MRKRAEKTALCSHCSFGLRKQGERTHFSANIILALLQVQAANEAKSQFLATMSHEMRTPLNAVLGLAQLVADSPLLPEQRAFMEQIQSSSRTLLALINDILDLTKVCARRCDMCWDWEASQSKRRRYVDIQQKHN